MLGIKITFQSFSKDCCWNTTNVNKLLTLTLETESLCSLEKAKGQRVPLYSLFVTCRVYGFMPRLQVQFEETL